jgi:hypothetical protein
MKTSQKLQSLAALQTTYLVNGKPFLTLADAQEYATKFNVIGSSGYVEVIRNLKSGLKKIWRGKISYSANKYEWFERIEQ